MWGGAGPSRSNDPTTNLSLRLEKKAIWSTEFTLLHTRWAASFPGACGEWMVQWEDEPGGRPAETTTYIPQVQQAYASCSGHPLPPIQHLPRFLGVLPESQRVATCEATLEDCCGVSLGMFIGPTGGATPRILGRQLPLPPPPPPPLGAFGQQLVAKGVALGRPWAPKAPDAP